MKIVHLFSIVSFFVFLHSEMEGQDIPYKKFHFNALYEFLYASNQFHMFSTRCGFYVRARLLPSSMHIAKLVGAQNCVRTNKNMKLPRKSSGDEQKNTLKVIFF